MKPVLRSDPLKDIMRTAMRGLDSRQVARYVCIAGMGYAQYMASYHARDPTLFARRLSSMTQSFTKAGCDTITQTAVAMAKVPGETIKDLASDFDIRYLSGAGLADIGIEKMTGVSISGKVKSWILELGE